MGGKGTQRRIHQQKAKQGTAVSEDKKLMTCIKSYTPKQLADVEEANFFHADNTVTHVRKPLCHYAFQHSFVAVQGKAVTKQLKDMMPEILKQVGPAQMAGLQGQLPGQGAAAAQTAPAEDSDEDQPPPLVGGNFQDAAKK